MILTVEPGRGEGSFISRNNDSRCRKRGGGGGGGGAFVSRNYNWGEGEWRGHGGHLSLGKMNPF